MIYKFSYLKPCLVLIQTYAIEDCHYYNDTVYQNTTTPVQLDKTLPNGAFTVEYDGLQTTRDNSASYLLISRGTNDRILIGQYARAGTNGIILYTGSQANHPLPNNTTLNAWNHFTFTYDGSDYKIDRDGENITVTGVGIHLDKVLSVENGYAGKLKNIKVKPL